MKKTFILSTVLFALSASVAFALSPIQPSRLELLKHQLASLLKQVEEIKKEIKEIEIGQKDFCFNFDVNLGIGARGSSVVALHKVLAREGFAVSSPEGQFDEETGAAVSGFQEKYRAEILSSAGLKFGTGYVGVATRAKLNQLYACEKPPVERNLKVSVPNGGESWKLGSSQTISWQGSGELRVSSPNYDISLNYWIPPCKSVTLCPVVVPQAPRLIAQNISANHFQWTVGNASDGYGAISPGYYFVRVCESGTNRCDSSNDKFNIYDTPNTGNKPPVIHSFETPTQLKVGATGTWAVKASDPENGSLSYSIVWGDETYAAAPSGSSDAKILESYSQSSTFTHSYSSPGTYKVRLVVRDSSGAVAETSATTLVVAAEDQTIGTLKVRVLNGSIVCITTPCEFGLSGATVQVYDLSGTAILRTGTTDGDGYVTLRDLKPYLWYPVRIVRGGFVTQETKVYINSGPNSLIVRLQIEATPLPVTQ